jgi:hypothetical protein
MRLASALGAQQVKIFQFLLFDFFDHLSDCRVVVNITLQIFDDGIVNFSHPSAIDVAHCLLAS